MKRGIATTAPGILVPNAQPLTGGKRTNSMGRAAEDCHACCRRKASNTLQMRCDRQRPRCNVCTEARKICSGYPLKLQWQGGALRLRRRLQSIQVQDTRKSSFAQPSETLQKDTLRSHENICYEFVYECFQDQYIDTSFVNTLFDDLIPKIKSLPQINNESEMSIPKQVDLKSQENLCPNQMKTDEPPTSRFANAHGVPIPLIQPQGSNYLSWLTSSPYKSENPELHVLLNMISKADTSSKKGPSISTGHQLVPYPPWQTLPAISNVQNDPVGRVVRYPPSSVDFQCLPKLTETAAFDSRGIQALHYVRHSHEPDPAAQIENEILVKRLIESVLNDGKHSSALDASTSSGQDILPTPIVLGVQPVILPARDRETTVNATLGQLSTYVTSDLEQMLPHQANGFALPALLRASLSRNT